MSLDISDILKDWPYKPGQVSARRIRGRDGKDKIQLRLDLGLLQMEADGRPDGERPHGFDSLLSYHENRLREYRKSHGTETGFTLDEKDCELLRMESVMFYHRYLAEFILEDYQGVRRDTMRNLRLMDLCRDFAVDAASRNALEQYRPYVIMMHTRARAAIAMDDNRPRAALAAVRRGIADIQAFYKEHDPDHADNDGELAVLRALANDIESRIPEDPAEKLRKELALAVAEERYEEAAAIRDKLNRLKEKEDTSDV